MRTKSNTMISILVILLLLPSVLALSKPISGQLLFEHTPQEIPVTTFIEVDPGFDTPRTCITTSNTGPDGSFSTNLENMVMQDAPTIRCNSFWKAGDSIWYQTNYNNQQFNSQSQTIQQGTGLQRLNNIAIPQPENALPTPPSSSSSSSGGGAGGAATTNPIGNEQTPTITLTHSIDKNTLTATATTSPAQEIRLLLFEQPNNNLLESHSSQDPVTQFQFTIDLSQYQPGHFTLQAIGYTNNQPTSYSTVQSISWLPPQQQQIVPPKPAQRENKVGNAITHKSSISAPGPTTFATFSYIISFFLLLTALILFMKKQRKGKEVDPEDILIDKQETFDFHGKRIKEDREI